MGDEDDFRPFTEVFLVERSVVATGDFFLETALMVDLTTALRVDFAAVFGVLVGTFTVLFDFFVAIVDVSIYIAFCGLLPRKNATILSELS